MLRKKGSNLDLTRRYIFSFAFYLTDKGEVFHNPREKKGLWAVVDISRRSGFTSKFKVVMVTLNNVAEMIDNITLLSHNFICWNPLVCMQTISKKKKKRQNRERELTSVPCFSSSWLSLCGWNCWSCSALELRVVKVRNGRIYISTTECVHYRKKSINQCLVMELYACDSWMHTTKNPAIGSLPSMLSTEECTDGENHTKIVIVYINEGNCSCIS